MNRSGAKAQQQLQEVLRSAIPAVGDDMVALAKKISGAIGQPGVQSYTHKGLQKARQVRFNG